MKKCIAIFFTSIMLSFLFCGCEMFEYENDGPKRRSREVRDETTSTETTVDVLETISLDADAIVYESPDGQSAQKGIVTASDSVEYISTKMVDGVVWYETEQGWFSVFVPTDHNGRVISSGVAKENIRILSGATDSAAEVGTYEAGTHIEIYLLRGAWAQTDLGWIVKDSIYIPGQIGKNSGWGLTLSDMGCYSAPNYDSARVTEYRSLFRIKLYETITINTVSWGYTDSGWVDLTNVYVEGTTGDGACSVQVIDKTPLNVRVGPGTGYDILRSLPVRTYVNVLFQVTVNDSNWGFIGDGWIYMDLVEIQ